MKLAINIFRLLAIIAAVAIVALSITAVLQTIDLLQHMTDHSLLTTVVAQQSASVAASFILVFLSLMCNPNKLKCCKDCKQD